MKKSRKARELARRPEIRDLQPGWVAAAAETPDPDLGTEEAGLFRLKMHVDNPGQTPM